MLVLQGIRLLEVSESSWLSHRWPLRGTFVHNRYAHAGQTQP
ncbi:hypothetical protein [Bartonella sp. DGB2]